MARHVGMHVDTGEHLLIHFMLIPEQTTNALVSETARIPEPLRGNVLRALGDLQGPEDLAQALSRRLYSDTSKSLFQVLHETGHLKAVEIDKIAMTPDGNHRIPLRAVLESIGRIPRDNGVSADMANPSPKFNPHTYNTAAGQNDATMQQAQNLLAEAELLDGDANMKRQQAYMLAPSLNPALATPAAAPAAPTAPDAPTDAPASDTPNDTGNA